MTQHGNDCKLLIAGFDGRSFEQGRKQFVLNQVLSSVCFTRYSIKEPFCMFVSIACGLAIERMGISSFPFFR